MNKLLPHIKPILYILAGIVLIIFCAYYCGNISPSWLYDIFLYLGFILIPLGLAVILGKTRLHTAPIIAVIICVNLVIVTMYAFFISMTSFTFNGPGLPSFNYVVQNCCIIALPAAVPAIVMLLVTRRHTEKKTA